MLKGQKKGVSFTPTGITLFLSLPFLFLQKWGWHSQSREREMRVSVVFRETQSLAYIVYDVVDLPVSVVRSNQRHAEDARTHARPGNKLTVLGCKEAERRCSITASRLDADNKQLAVGLSPTSQTPAPLVDCAAIHCSDAARYPCRYCMVSCATGVQKVHSLTQLTKRCDI